MLAKTKMFDRYVILILPDSVKNRPADKTTGFHFLL